VADPVTQAAPDDGFGPSSFISPYDEQQRAIDYQTRLASKIRDIATGMRSQADNAPRSFQSGGNEIMLNHNPGTLAALGPTAIAQGMERENVNAQGALNTQKRAAFQADSEAAHSALLPQNYPQKQRIDPNTGKPQVINGQAVFEPDMDAAQRSMLHQARVMQSYGPAGAQLAQALQAKGEMLAQFHAASAGQQLGTFNAAGPSGQQYQTVGNAPETVQGGPGSQTGVRSGSNISGPQMTVPQPLTVGPADRLAVSRGGDISQSGVQGATQWEQIPGAPGYIRDRWHPETIINQATQKPADPDQVDYITRKLPFLSGVTNDLSGNQFVQSYKSTQQAFDGMKQNVFGHAGDAAMLSGFGEILGQLHPRASQMSAQEQALTANAAGAIQRYKSYLDQHKGVLSPELKQELLDTAAPLVDIQKRLAGKEVSRYLGIAKHYGVDPGEVWQAAGVPPTSAAQPISQGVQVPQSTQQPRRSNAARTTNTQQPDTNAPFPGLKRAD
jgi:hypothetical protein